ncbi:hypothetical protein FN846DRAFT_438643 [Sphaerosporella brunnea]|uniref:Uncharacterized protein n=1 Tax=Sphaerosporella brunnea TaxID=1250544 RepID=A0A5J5F4W4_9PEZI|nr:hypothetical protein FN846DRAFT_438643 [Sphaerosporella brunnea]
MIDYTTARRNLFRYVQIYRSPLLTPSLPSHNLALAKSPLASSAARQQNSTAYPPFPFSAPLTILSISSASARSLFLAVASSTQSGRVRLCCTSGRASFVPLVSGSPRFFLPLLHSSLRHQIFPQPASICRSSLRSTRLRNAAPVGSWILAYSGLKQTSHRPNGFVGLDAGGRVHSGFSHTAGSGLESRAKSWFLRCTAMSRSRVRRPQMSHSVVRPPHNSSCAVRPVRICSASGLSGEPSCGTSRRQNGQRISLAGQVEVRWEARSRREEDI